MNGGNRMESIMEIIGKVLPVVIVGGIAIFIIKKLEHKQKQGKTGRKNSNDQQDLLDSLIPLGMLFGCVVGVIFNILFSFSLLSTLSFGSGAGLLLGYFVYEIYSRTEVN